MLAFTTLHAGQLAPDLDVNLLDKAQAEALFPYPEGLIDANNDLIKWRWLDGEGYSYENSSVAAADDWLISNPIVIEQGKTYILTVTARCSHAKYPEKLEVRMGADIEAASMTIPAIAPTTINRTDPHEITGSFTADRPDELRIGLHAISDADMAFLHVSRLSLKADTSVPDIDPDGQPAITIQGNVLTADSQLLPVTIYDTTGRSVMVITTSGQHTLTLPHGIYIARTATQTLRFAL